MVKQTLAKRTLDRRHKLSGEQKKQLRLLSSTAGVQELYGDRKQKDPGSNGSATLWQAAGDHGNCPGLLPLNTQEQAMCHYAHSPKQSLRETTPF